MIVIDTNVIAVANGHSQELEDDCIEASQDFLLNALKTEVILIDDDLEIISEYQKYANRSGQPGVGDVFFKWLWYNGFSEDRVKSVKITPIEDEHFLFAEIPQNEELIGFDRSDQKFLAVALKIHPKAKIINSSDSDWRKFQEPIKAVGVEILNLC